MEENNVTKQEEQQPNTVKQEQPKNKKEIRKHLVDSSNLEWVGYDEEKQDLYIGFRNNTVYVYHEVPKDIFDGLLKAGSKGRYFWIKIRKKPFKYERIK